METAPVQQSIDEMAEMVIVSQPKSTTPDEKPASEIVFPFKGGQNKKVSKEAKKITTDMAHEIAEDMNKVASVFNTSLVFTVDEPTGKTVIKVMDEETNEVIRQIPPEEMLRLIKTMRNVMGMLLDIEI